MTASPNTDNPMQVGDKAKTVSLPGWKIKLTPKQVDMLKIIIPLAVIAICAVIVTVMVYVSLSGADNIAGRFVLSASSDSAYIELDSNGSYFMSGDSFEQNGEWNYENGKIKFAPSSGKTFNARFVDGKYIAIEDETFFAGDIPDTALFDAEVTSVGGESFGFRSDGKFYIADDSRNTELGSYITDGYFIIVTTKEGSMTYLNCGDGITSSFYQAS